MICFVDWRLPKKDFAVLALTELRAVHKQVLADASFNLMQLTRFKIAKRCFNFIFSVYNLVTSAVASIGGVLSMM